MKIKGYTVFLVKCADGRYFSGMCRDLTQRLREINIERKGYYFHTHPKRLPVEVVFKEEGILFKEAYVKYLYLRTLPRKRKERLIVDGWFYGKILRKFVENV
jgi:predicted GIY-YIG superfamily endonuclease